MKDKYFIIIYDAENDRRLYLKMIQPTVNNNIEAVFTQIISASKEFESLADAQAFCKILISNYVKTFMYDEEQLPIDIKNTLEVAMCYVNYHGKPFPIWSIN